MSKTNDLIDFMHSLTREMGSEYNRIQKRSTEDLGTAGDQGEENWAAIFRNWLPADYQVVTKGRLLSEKGLASPQVDVIILHPFYPKHLLDKKLYLTAGVAAAFECKNTLRSKDIEKSVKNSKEIRNLINLRQSNYKEELNSPLLYGLVAHSHSWNSENSKPMEVIHNKLIQEDQNTTVHPRECLDFLCVSDLATWTSYKMPMRMANYELKGKRYYKWIPGVQTAFGKSYKEMFRKGSEPNLNFTPIGTLLTRVFKKLALTDKRLEDFSWYFGQAVGGGANLEWRDWDESILSKEARQDLIINEALYHKQGFMGDA